MKLFAVTNYTTFYGKNPPDDSFKQIGHYPTDVILVLLCKANAGLFQVDQDTIEGRAKIFMKVFYALSKSKKERIAELLLRPIESNEPEYRIIFNKPALSWLIAKCFTFYKPMNSYQTESEQKIHDDVFDAVLIANELYYSETDGFETGSYEQIWHIMLRQQNYIRDLISMIQNGTLKMMFFRKFIETTFPEGPEWIKEFCNKLQIKHFIGYGSFLMDVLGRSFRQYEDDGVIRWHLEANDSTQALINCFSHRPSDFETGNPAETLHGGLIPKPIYYAMNQYAVVLDFNFLAWLIETALPYNFYEFTSLKKDSRFKKFENFKGLLGKSFYEEFVGQSLVKKLFARATYFTDIQLNGLTDLMLIQDSDIFLFEFKSAALNYRVLDDLNIHQFKDFINRNFLASKNTDKKNKGVFQLINCIRGLTESGEINHVLKPGHKYSIYPVIIYLDPILENHGVNAYCNETFVAEANEYRESFRHIYPVTLINLNFFMMHYALLKGRFAFLKKYIKGYHDRVASNMKSYAKSGQGSTFLNGCISFDHYVQEFLERDTEGVRLIAQDFNLPSY